MKTKPLTWIIACLCLLIVSGLLAGCGGDKKEAAAPPAAQPAAQTESIEAIFAKAKQMPGISYESVITAKDMTVNAKIWVEKNKVKMEQTVRDQKFVMYFDGEDMYQYDAGKNIAMKFPIKAMEGKGIKRPDPAAYTEQMAPGSLKVLETVVYEGVKCRVVSYTMKEGEQAVKMWIREDYGFPMRMEIVMKNGDKIMTENKNVKIGAIPEDTFKLPAGAKIQDMSEMMKSLPQTPKQ